MPLASQENTFSLFACALPRCVSDMAPSEPNRRCISCGCFAKDVPLDRSFDQLFCKRCSPKGPTWVSLVKQTISQPVNPARGTLAFSCPGCATTIGDRQAILYPVPLCLECIDKGLSAPPLKVQSEEILEKHYEAAKKALNDTRDLRLQEIRAEGRPFDPKAFADVLKRLRAQADSPAGADVVEFAFALRCKRGAQPFVPLSLQEARCGFTTTFYMQPPADAARCADVVMSAIDGLELHYKPGVADADVIPWLAAVAMRGFAALTLPQRKRIAALLLMSVEGKVSKAPIPVKTLRTMTDSPTQLTPSAIASVAHYLQTQPGAPETETSNADKKPDGKAEKAPSKASSKSAAAAKRR
jgi:hypothetical protein